MQENSNKYNFRRDTNPRNPLGLNTSYNGSAEKTQNPRVGRPGRSTDLPILQYRSTGPVDRANPRVGVCQSRASGRPGRSTAQTRELGVCQSEPCGRPGRSTATILCMLCTSVDRAGRPTLLTPVFSAVFCCCPFALIVDFLGDPRRNLALFYSCLTSPLSSLLQQFSTSVKIFSKSEPISNEPQSITWRNRHTISAKSTHDLGLESLAHLFLENIAHAFSCTSP